jgi:hypothetical protein
MLSTAERKEAIRKFKERKPRMGVYAVRCAATAQIWAGSAVNLDAIQNRLWFCLRLGKNTDPSLQRAWDALGEPAFEYQILEELPDDLPPLAIKDVLKEKRAAWLAHLSALPI